VWVGAGAGGEAVGEVLFLNVGGNGDVVVLVFAFTSPDKPREVPITIEGSPGNAGWRTFLGSDYIGESTGLEFLPCADEVIDLIASNGALIGEMSTDPGESAYLVSYNIVDIIREGEAFGACTIRFW